MRFLLTVLLAIVLGLTAGCSATQSKQASTNDSNSGLYSTDFATFKKNYEAKTKAQKDEFWETIKGKEVKWSGEVNDAFPDAANKSTKIVIVQTGSDFVKFTLASTENVDIAKLNKGDKISLKGALAEQGSLLKSWGVANAIVVK